MLSVSEQTEQTEQTKQTKQTKQTDETNQTDLSKQVSNPNHHPEPSPEA
jgi:hypothetical protein